jgi:hypothetical protein
MGAKQYLLTTLMTLPDSKNSALNPGNWPSWKIVAASAGGLLVAAIAADAQQPTVPTRKITAAFIDVNRNSLSESLAARLSASDKATWLTRTDIDKTLATQKINALPAFDSASERKRLGRLLKAEILVLMRTTQEAKDPAVEIIIAEASLGQSLVRQRISVTTDTSQLVAGLVKIVERELMQHARALLS